MRQGTTASTACLFQNESIQPSTLSRLGWKNSESRVSFSPSISVPSAPAVASVLLPSESEAEESVWLVCAFTRFLARLGNDRLPCEDVPFPTPCLPLPPFPFPSSFPPPSPCLPRFIPHSPRPVIPANPFPIPSPSPLALAAKFVPGPGHGHGHGPWPKAVVVRDPEMEPEVEREMGGRTVGNECRIIRVFRGDELSVYPFHIISYHSIPLMFLTYPINHLEHVLNLLRAG